MSCFPKQNTNDVVQPPNAMLTKQQIFDGFHLYRSIVGWTTNVVFFFPLKMGNCFFHFLNRVFLFINRFIQITWWWCVSMFGARSK